MRLTQLTLKNWRNFTKVDIPLQRRVFIVGNNGLGKSNLLDALRFLRDIAKGVGGGLQDAIARRGGIRRIRSLFARKNPSVEIGVDAEESDGNGGVVRWHYHLTLRQEQSGNRRVLVDGEVVKRNDDVVLSRPNEDDEADSENMTQTALEQTLANRGFRPLARFFQNFCYLHMVPQLVRHATDFQGQVLPDDPFGQNLLNKMAELSQTIRQSRLRRIGEALRQIKPRFGEFSFERDEKTGKPHLQFRFQDWRHGGSMQNEEQLSDGELRLIGLVWTLLESGEVIMLEEPEISFNEGIVGTLPGIFARAALSRKKGGGSQIFLTTHSAALLSDPGIPPEEVILLETAQEGTKATLASSIPSIANQIKADVSVADAVLRFARSDGYSLGDTVAKGLR